MSSATDGMPAGEISPYLLVDTMYAYTKSAAIKAAIELDLFSAIGPEGSTTEKLSAATNASERGVRILCDLLVVNGFLVKDGTRYLLTPSSTAFLVRNSPAYMGAAIDFLVSPEMLGLFLTDPTAYVRNGGSLGLANMEANNPVWVKFARGMEAFTGGSAMVVAAEAATWPVPPRKILDIAAGPGRFGIELAKLLETAEVVAVDWQPVLDVAVENAEKAGIAARYRVIAGSAFDVDWGRDYDLILLPNFLHHFDVETCVGLLRKCKASLAAAGKVAVIEFVPNADRVTPPIPAAFAWVMLATTPKGDAYTEKELADMANAAGFRSVSLKPLPPTPASLLVCEQ
ncbi:methyltransferase domain-containing protein [Rhizobiaceae bacterium n13]|uniref:class I SAM-dependent methyltransferase n=1 Tax=Ferirhizobium litorale TaxID=2927786 RepID=UPI0024B29D38|nr:class I SAM-dependent methyltransferase [Fererhizobium litorale]MDI7861464.1 methyltransferase domain-containing protein [Fererhizobium litorale]